MLIFNLLTFSNSNSYSNIRVNEFHENAYIYLMQDIKAAAIITETAKKLDQYWLNLKNCVDYQSLLSLFED